MKLLLDGKVSWTRALNVSMTGLMISGAPRIPNDQVTVAIPFDNDREVIIQAAIKRQEGSQLALEFGALDWEDLFALARYLHPRLP